MSNIIIKIKKVTSLFLTKIKLDSLALWFAMRHPETPKYIMVILWLVVAYALSPIDLIPDFIPIAGIIDDVALIAWIYDSIREDIDNFLEWEKTKLK